MLLFNLEFDFMLGFLHLSALVLLASSRKLGQSALMESSCKPNLSCNSRRSNQDFHFLSMLINVTITNVTIVMFLIVPSTEDSVSTLGSH